MKRKQTIIKETQEYMGDIIQYLDSGNYKSALILAKSLVQYMETVNRIFDNKYNEQEYLKRIIKK